MKRFATSWVVLGIMVVGGLVYLGIQVFADSYISSKPTESVAACRKTGLNHVVVLHDDTARPNHVVARLCDKLTLENADDQIRLVAFGEHENHQAYDGVLEKVLQKNQSLTVTLSKTGTYTFHDHLEDSVQGTFTVN